MTDYTKETKLRVQVMVDESRYEQIATLAELTGSSVSRIVRLALESKADEFDQAILQARANMNQSDLYRSVPVPKKAGKKGRKKARKKASKDKRRIGQKPITNDSFAKLINKQKKNEK